jgi:hypothetical protein
MNLKLSTLTLSMTLMLATFTARAGDVNLLGNLNVASNLTGALVGYKYVTVAEGTNDTHRGKNLQSAYAVAASLSPTFSNRVAVIIPPGNYSLGTTNLIMNTSYVDLVGLIPAQMTTKQVFTDSAGRKRSKTVANVQCPVRIYAAVGSGSGTIMQNIDNARIESLILSNTGSGVAYYPSVAGTNTILRHVAMNSMRAGVAYAGQYVDCVSSNWMAFGGGGAASGTFIDCVGDVYSFGGNWGTASGTFIGCVGSDDSFSGHGGVASGTFIDCVSGNEGFGSGDAYDYDNGTAGGTFKGCVGGPRSFGGNAGVADGTFVDCVGGDNSFGGPDGEFNYSGTASGKFTDCVGGDYSFGTSGTANGVFRACTGGVGSFGGYGTASGYFTDCTGGWNSFGGQYNASATFIRCVGNGSFGAWGTASGTFIDCTDASYGFGVWGTLASTAKLQHCRAANTSFGAFTMSSDDFNYNLGGSNTFLMLPNLPTNTNGLPRGSVWTIGGTLKIVQ